MKSIVLVGRPNVGKSTIFNVLTSARKALVADFSGVTRDRREGKISIQPQGTIKVIDTGGWLPNEIRRTRKDEKLLHSIEKQILMALQEAAVVFLVVDIRAGLQALDEKLALFLRKHGKLFWVLANKCDSVKQEALAGDFASLGAAELIPISAEHKYGLPQLLEKISSELDITKTVEPSPVKATDSIKLCIVGRPNVGKSSLLNSLLGEERAVIDAVPGTTTDPIDVELERAGKKFTLIDTAGIRRHAKREHQVEQLAVMYAKRNLENADIALLVVDAEEGITAQDATIAAMIDEVGAAVVIIANKWDKAPHRIHKMQDTTEQLEKHIREEMPFLDYAPLLCISAKKSKIYDGKFGEGAAQIGFSYIPKDFTELWPFIAKIVEIRNQEVPTSVLNKIVMKAMSHGPNLVRNVGKVYFAHQVGKRPPQFLAFVKNAKNIPEDVRRYLSRAVREGFGFPGHPIRWIFKNKHKQ